MLTSLRFEDLNLDHRVSLLCVEYHRSMCENLVDKAVVPRCLSHSHEDRENALKADLSYVVP